ncbi:hypothetical protein Tco_0748312 [Tanacetum coccineum]|uniref:Uncharacterized protein n=1 Tax=Tanacetum coccineum TaxID=301880 RepID=A0ABQ4YW85_9ASTR
MGDVNPISTLRDYSRPSHEGYRNSIELREGNNVVPLRSDTIRLVQNGCSFHGLQTEDPNQHLKDFLKLITVLTTNTPYPSRKIRHIRACTHQRPRRKQDPIRPEEKKEKKRSKRKYYDSSLFLLKNHLMFRETKARTILLQSLPEDHMADFHHLDDARDIWLAVKDRFGGKDESKKMRKSMLKHEFSEFRQAKPDNEICNMKFLVLFHLRGSQVALSLKQRVVFDYLSLMIYTTSFRNRTLEIDVKGGSSYDSRGHNVMENVLHSFVAESDPQQQITYEDFDQIGKLDLEELDIKWQMAMLSVRINRFEKKAGRKMKECTGKQLDSKARYSSFKLKELDKTEEPKALLSVDSMLNWSDHEGEDVENGAAQVYGMIAGAEEDATGGATGNATGDVADDVSTAAAEFALMGISSQVQTCPFGCEHLYAELKKEFDNVEAQYKECYIQVQAYKSTLQTLEQQKGWYQSNQLALEERIRILTANLENTTNMLKYTEKLNEQAKLEKMNDKVQLEESKARFDKWKDSSKNLDKLIHSSMSSRSKFGLGFGETFGSDEVFDPSGPIIFDTTLKDVAEKPLYDRFVKAVGMHAVPPPLTGTFMPPSNNPDLDDTQFTYGSKSNNYFETNSVSNDFVSCDNSDKSSDSETTDFASCVSSVKSSSSKTNEPLASAPSSVDSKPVSKTADQQSNSTNADSSFSFKENVKPPRNLCNKSGINSRSLCKRKSFGSKTCFVCGSKFHLIKDCDFYEKQLEVHNKPMWTNVANILSFVPKATSVPAGSWNRPSSVPAGSRNRSSSVPAGSRNRPSSVPADSRHKTTYVPAGVGHFYIASVFEGYVETPCAEMIWPRYSTYDTAKEHLLFLANKRMSSKNTSTNFLKKGLNIVFMRDWNVEDLKSGLENIADPLSSSITGIGTSLSPNILAQLPILNTYSLRTIFFLTITIGDEKGFDLF